MTKLVRLLGIALSISLAAGCGDDDGGGSGADGGNQNSGCLPSGSANLQTTFAGPITGAVTVGNELGCGAIQCGPTCMSVTFSLPHPTEAGNAITVALTIDGLTEGGTGTDLATSVTVGTGGANAGQWTGDCTTTVTEQTADDTSGTETIYKLAATTTCAQPLSSIIQDDLTMSSIAYTTAAVWTM